MKNKKNISNLLIILYLFLFLLGLIFILLIINLIVVYGSNLYTESKTEFDKYCISKGHEKFNKLEKGGKISCISYNNEKYFEFTPSIIKFYLSSLLVVFSILLGLLILGFVIKKGGL